MSLLDNLSGRSRTLRRARRKSELAALTVTSCATDLLRVVQRLGQVRRRAVAEAHGASPPPGEDPVTQATIDQVLRDMVMSTKMLGQVVDRVVEHLRDPSGGDDDAAGKAVKDQLDEVARCVTNLAKLCRMSSAEKRASQLSADVSSNTNVVAAVRQLLEAIPTHFLQELPARSAPANLGQIAEDGNDSVPQDQSVSLDDRTYAEEVGTNDDDADDHDDDDDDDDDDDESADGAHDQQAADKYENEAIQQIEETIYEKLVVQLDSQEDDSAAGESEGAPLDNESVVVVVSNDNDEADATFADASSAPAQLHSPAAPGPAPGRPLFANAGRVDGIPSGLRTGRARSDSLVQKLVKSGKNALRTKSGEERRKRANSVLLGREADAPDREQFLEASVPRLAELSLLPPDPDPTVYVRTLLLNEIYQTESVFLRDLQLMAVLYRDAAVERGVFEQTKRTGTLKLGLGFAADLNDGTTSSASSADHAESIRASEKVFGNLAELINLLHSLMSLLESQFAARGSAASVCQCYRSQAPSMSSVFGRYCRLFCVFGARQKKLARRSPQFRALLDDKARRRVCAGRDLATLQVTPVQRICRLPLLFRGLRDCYSPGSEDHKAASQVLELFDCIVTEINNILPKNK